MPQVMEIIRRFYPETSPAHAVLVAHSRMVTRKAVSVAEALPHRNPDIPFIRKAAMLHDIGIFQTHAPDIGCFGPHPYICHGYLGRALLESLGYPAHALVCERHTGCGLSAEEIRKAVLPIPERDMLPLSLEEQIICYADKFFSKNPGECGQEKPIAEIRRQMQKFGPVQLERFDRLHAAFSGKN